MAAEINRREVLRGMAALSLAPLAVSVARAAAELGHRFVGATVGDAHHVLHPVILAPSEAGAVHESSRSARIRP